ncbi:hypothetical protein D3C80_1421570 [compost metagenome]
MAWSSNTLKRPASGRKLAINSFIKFALRRASKPLSSCRSSVAPCWRTSLFISRSYTVIFAPFNCKSLANVSPPGPPPTIAIFLPCNFISSTIYFLTEQIYFDSSVENCIKRSFWFFNNSFGETPESFLTSLMKWDWSAKFCCGNNLPSLMC